MERSTQCPPIAIIGAGPFGLSLAARLEKAAVPYLIFGRPFDAWIRMPQGLLLRTKLNAGFDPFGDRSFRVFIEEHEVDIGDGTQPIPRELFIEYFQWFMRRTEIRVQEHYVRRIEKDGAHFVLKFESQTINARAVVVATGISEHAYVPAEYSQMIPAYQWAHTADAHDMQRFKDKRVLVIGGRAAGLEWSALLAEAGATVETVYRHTTPQFQAPDWTVLKQIVEGTLRDPAWFKHLTETDREEIVSKVRPAGKQKVEPWLASRMSHPNITLRPCTKVVRLTKEEDRVRVIVRHNNVLVELQPVDFVIFATGYKPALANISVLAESLHQEIASHEGYPLLTEHFESSVPGLYFTGLIAEKEFGPLMGFVNMCNASASILEKKLAGDS
ncbi:MAG: NAD(P)-binding domain-containing protein [Patescibacteria group bacterium]